MIINYLAPSNVTTVTWGWHVVVGVGCILRRVGCLLGVGHHRRIRQLLRWQIHCYLSRSTCTVLRIIIIITATQLLILCDTGTLNLTITLTFIFSQISRYLQSPYIWRQSIWKHFYLKILKLMQKRGLHKCLLLLSVFKLVLFLQNDSWHTYE